MEISGTDVVNMVAGTFNARKTQPTALSASEQATVSAICNRLSRMLGITDREGLQQDIAIVQAFRPLNLEALAAAPEKIFVNELLRLLDSTDRSTGTLAPDYDSLYRLDDLSATMR